MARGRESQGVKVITHREIKLFKQLARTGLTDRSQAKIFCNLNPERLKKLEKSGYIKLTNRAVAGKNTEIIQVANKGRDYCKHHLEISSFAAAQMNHLTHDLKLSMTYYSLPEHIQETWKHEREIIKEIYENHPDIKENLATCIDAKITVRGVDVAVEVVGDSYRQADLDLKQEIALSYAECQSIQFI